MHCILVAFVALHKDYILCGSTHFLITFTFISLVGKSISGQNFLKTNQREGLVLPFGILCKS